MPLPEKRQAGATAEVEITPEMIEAGLRAWEESAGDEYLTNSITNHLTVIDIYRSMKRAAPLAK